MIASTLTMTRDARARGYAVPAVNILDDLSLRAVIAAAVAARSPLIVQVSVKTVRSIGTPVTDRLSPDAETVPPSAAMAATNRAGWGDRTTTSSPTDEVIASTGPSTTSRPRSITTRRSTVCDISASR